MTKITITAIVTNRSASIDIADLPVLIGSEKQVEWATRIRDEAARDLLSTQLGQLSLLPSIEAYDARIAKVSAFAPKLEALIDAAPNASTWIDARDRSGKGSMRTIETILKAQMGAK